jgi:RNA polymerase sigma-70 factor (ECF subfamily)
VRQVDVDGQPGALLLDPDGRLVGVMALDILDGQIRAVASIVNPDKLAHMGPVSDMRALLARRRR